MASYNSNMSSNNTFPQMMANADDGDNFTPNMANNMTHHLHPNVAFDGVYDTPMATTQLRRPNIVNSDINDLTRKANDMSLNDNTLSTNVAFSSVGGGDVVDHWINFERPSMASTANNTTPSLNPYAKEFVPQSAMLYSANAIAKGVSNDWSRASNQTGNQWENKPSDDFIALNYLKDFIDTITTKPNKFDTGITQLTHVINDYMDEDELVMDAVVNTIVDQSIVDPQFRYNGVRLCIHFMDSLIPYNAENTFKGLLLKRCQREHSRRERLMKGTEVMVNYLRGVSMFIGDLYSRSGEQELAEYLPQFLLTLMSDISKEKYKENLKSVCQVLKLCGASMDKHFVSIKRDDLRQVIEQLKKCRDNNDVSPQIKELITSILAMEMRGWISNIPLAANNPIFNPYLNNTFTDGNGANYEDYNDEYTGYSDEEDYQICYDFGQCGDEVNDEVCEAFEEFLKNSGQTSK